jgi:hypothetical protein
MTIKTTIGDVDVQLRRSTLHLLVTGLAFMGVSNRSLRPARLLASQSILHVVNKTEVYGPMLQPKMAVCAAGPLMGTKGPRRNLGQRLT